MAAPEGLSADWKATSVRFQGDDFDAWHLGFHAPDGEYVQIEQSTQKPSDVHRRRQPGRMATKATQEIDGRTWTRYTGGRYDALVLTGEGLDDGGRGHGLVRAADGDGAGAEGVRRRMTT